MLGFPPLPGNCNFLLSLGLASFGRMQVLSKGESITSPFPGSLIVSASCSIEDSMLESYYLSFLIAVVSARASKAIFTLHFFFIVLTTGSINP